MPERMLTYSATVFILAAFMKYAEQMALRTRSHSVPHDATRILSCAQMSRICCRTSLTLRIALACTKWRVHQSPR